MLFRAILSAFAAAAVFSAPPVRADLNRLDPDIAAADIEELLNLTITSASRIPQSLEKVSAAVSVLSAADIRRSGARTIPDLLRWIPGVQVANVDSSRYAVSIRGFNARAANNLLVMVDGRSIYNPLFSGTLWETKEMLLENIERIEVIRGPAGTAWGANAVNGVINIITKRAQDTLGTYASAGAGNEELGFGQVRQGVTLDEGRHLRLSGYYRNRDEGAADGGSDDSYTGAASFRLDDDNSDGESWTLQGGYSAGDHDGVLDQFNFDHRDFVLQWRWRKQIEDDSNVNLNSYYVRSEFDSPTVGEKRDTAEIDLQYNSYVGERLALVQGIQYRITSDDLKSTQLLSLEPDQRTDTLLGAYVNGRAVLVPDEVELTLGARVEHNDYTAFEVESEIGVSWAPWESDLLWASVSRAVRTPSRLETDFLVNFNNSVFVGNRTLQPEALISYEAGYRSSISRHLNIDLAVFFNSYDDLIYAEQLTLANNARGHTYGVELAPSWRGDSGTVVTAGYTLLFMDLTLRPGSQADPAQVIEAVEGRDPEHQAFVRLGLSPFPGWLFDFGLRYVDALSVPPVSHYIVGDARVSWQVSREVEVAVIGQNLFRARHYEQGHPHASQVQQGVYGEVTWRF